MRKREFVLMAMLLALAIAAPARAAPSFWGGFLTNGSFRLGGFTTGPSVNADSNANSAGFQYADTGVTPGEALVVQAEGAAGFQDGDEDSQEQGMIAGMGQVVTAADGASATGLQGGVAGQTQTNDCGTQTQYVSGVQYASVSTSPGSTATVTQTTVILVYQSQECGEDAEAPGSEVEEAAEE